jgi:hypothetical protein
MNEPCISQLGCLRATKQRNHVRQALERNLRPSAHQRQQAPVSWMSARTAPLEQLDHEELQRRHAQLLHTVRSFSPGTQQLLV